MEMKASPVINPGKNEIITVDGVDYRRLCVKTHVIQDGDSIPEVAMEYAAPHMQEGDVLFITEKAVVRHWQALWHPGVVLQDRRGQGPGH